jgi:hypothetical protein
MDKYIFLIIIIIILISCIITDKINKIEHYIIDSKIDGPIILLIAGTHGNEPAGTYALENLINSNISNISITRGKIIIIPRVNKIGLFLNLRWGFNSFIPIDYNRNYPSSKNGKTGDYVNKQIINFVNMSDFIIDFHEGWGYNIINPKSMGSSLYPSNNIFSIKIAEKILVKLNNNIFEPNKKFTINTNSPRIKNTLDSYINSLNKNYLLVETTGQNNVQPLELRIQQITLIINTVIEMFNMNL